jgi:serine protease Do
MEAASVLSGLETTLNGLATRLGPSVVGLGRGWGGGSGVVVAENRVLTVAHALPRRDAPTITFADGRRAEATVLAVDADAELAVLEVDTGDAPVLAPGAAPPSIGAAVIALANPGGRGLRATLGFVTTAERAVRGPRGRRIAGAIEHSAPLPRGSSGGPLVTVAGELVGLNAIRLDGGLILAVPAEAERVERLARGEQTARPRLGIALASPRAARRLRQAVGLPERDGLLVRAVADDSPAAQAGVQRGDLVVAAGGKPVAGLDDLHEAIDAASSVIDLTLVRGVDELDAPVRLVP